MVSHYSGPEVIEIRESEVATPGPEQVVIRVLASAVSGADVNMRRGTYPMQKKAPLALGYCIVGDVEAVGSSVTACRKGDRVACLTIYGGFADYCVVLAKHCVPVSAQADTSQVAALVLDGMTAYQMLTRKLQLKTGSRVFVHGASGAVGSALAGLAKHRGIEVWGTASPKKHAELKSKFGLTQVFDYRDPEVASQVARFGGVDAVFDPLGYDSFPKSFSMLRHGGTVIGYGFNGNVHNGQRGNIFVAILKFFVLNLNTAGKKATFYGINRDSADFQEDLKSLVGQVLSQTFVPTIKKRFKLAEVADAHRYWASGEGIGSIVINP